jgi:hypothetical protein
MKEEVLTDVFMLYMYSECILHTYMSCIHILHFPSSNNRYAA